MTFKLRCSAWQPLVGNDFYKCFCSDPCMTQPSFFAFYCKTIFAVCFWQEYGDLDDTVQVNIINFSSQSAAPGRPIKITGHTSTEKITCWRLTKILGWFIAFYSLNSEHSQQPDRWIWTIYDHIAWTIQCFNYIRILYFSKYLPCETS